MRKEIRDLKKETGPVVHVLERETEVRCVIEIGRVILIAIEILAAYQGI